jgi:hypothetical protein
MNTLRLLCCLAACGLLVPARAEIVDLKFDASGRFERQLVLKPRGFVEVCGALAAGQAVHWSFQADAALDFNIHYHQGKDVHYPAKMGATREAKGELQADSAQDYCWMWAAPGAATLRVALSRR